MQRAAIIVFLMVMTLSSPALSADDPYETLFYDYEVAGYCGLVTKSVYTAFGYKRAALEVDSGKDVEQLTKARIRAMAAADREYMNRGLGGFKPWCQNEGAASVQRILAD